MNKHKKKLAGSPGLPQAWISVKKNRQKRYNQNDPSEHGVIYFKDQQEFEIELYNPTNLSVLTKIKVNGNYISNRGLILEPGQRWFLDRHIDSDRKLRFSTYKVENNNRNQDAIAKNGLVEVEFYSEVVNYGGTNWNPTWTSTPYWQQDWNKPFITYTNGTGGMGNGVFTLNSFNDNNTTLSGNASTTTSYFSSTLNVGDGGLEAGDSIQMINSSLNTTNHEIETGRIKEGSKSDQEFEEGHGNFTSWATSISTYKIMPVSTKPLEKKDVRNYCPGCRTRVRKSTWKFCPNCGEDLG